MKSADNPSALQNAQKAEKSARKLYQKSRLAQKRLHTLLKFLPDPVFAFTLDKKVEYINPAFERVFGWTLKEVKGKNIKFIPDHLIAQAKKGMKQLFENQSIHEFETQRYTKDGRILDISIDGSILYDEQNKPAGQVLILRNITTEKRMEKSNQILFRISRALHQYLELGDLIAFINKEIQKLISVEGAFILLADKSKDQLYFFSAQYRNAESEKKFKKIRFSADQGVSGRVYKTGEPLIILDAANCPFFLRRVEDETDLVTKNMLSVPIKLKDRIIGVISVTNKSHGEFDNTDVELLSMVTNTIALPIENTRIHEELKRSYKELKTLNRAKDNVINHLAHELKTPVSVLGASMKLLSKKLKAAGLQDPLIEKILTRGQRNLNRILDIQYEVEDLLRKKDFKAYHILNRLLDACKDELNILIESETDNIDIIKRVHDAIENLFGPKKIQSKYLLLNEYLINRIDQLRPEFQHRNCVLNTRIDKNIPVFIPPEILDIITKGIIRNAFEYTPDAGQIDIVLKNTGNDPELIVTDSGIGFTREKLHLIFENYFTPPDSIDYSTKKPYDFNAGGRGFDLLRIKIFSEKYHFKIWIDSNRCGVIPKDNDICPGDIHLCRACKTPNDCFASGGTSIHIKFPVT
ncbi:PAS domain S-box protein [Desulfobacula toluolica]|uniref:PAS domain S-box protein n=1 Tax=Desulfobacula toluolica TaxID=28223 RepID=UPI00031228FA|nr:PAS domain S-box protein [Desulfobacula toluolica]